MVDTESQTPVASKLLLQTSEQQVHTVAAVPLRFDMAMPHDVQLSQSAAPHTQHCSLAKSPGGPSSPAPDQSVTATATAIAASNSTMGDIQPQCIDSGAPGLYESDPPPTQIGPVLTYNSTAAVATSGPPSSQLPEHLRPHAITRASDPGIIQQSLATVRDSHLASSRKVHNVSMPGAGEASSPPLPSMVPGAVTGGPALLRSGSSGMVSFNASRAMPQSDSQAEITSTQGATLLAAADAARGIAASPSFRRQQSGGGGGSLRRQPSGGAVLSVTFSDPGSTNRAFSHPMTLNGESSCSGRMNGEHDRPAGSARREDSNGGRRHGWLRGFSCFGGGSSDRPVGYHGQDDLTAVAKERKEAQKVRKYTSRGLSKALSDTFMVRSSRPAPIVAGAKGTATSEAANTCPGSPGGGRYSTRKLQPMLSLQPQKSILKSSSLKRRALETDPIFIKVASARLGVITHELTNTAASTADIAGAGSDCEELNLDNRAAPLAMTMSEGGTSDSPAPGTASTASMRPNLTSPLRSSVPDLQAARATGDISARVEAIAAEVATADDPQSQLWSMFSSENIPSSGPMSPKAAVGRLEPRISVVTAKGSTAAPGAAGWFLDSALNGSGTPSPAVADSGYRALMKSTSFKLTTQAGTMGQTLLASVDTPASGGPGSVPRGGSGRAVALSTSGYPNIGPTNGGEGAGGGGGGGSCDGAQPSIVQRITRQLSRGAGGSLGGGSSPKDATGSPGDIRGGNSPMGRSTPRNAVLPLPPMMLMPNSTGGGGNAAESQPLPPTPTRMASLRHSAAGDPACLMTAGSQPETPSYPSSPSHQESLRYRRLAGRSSKLAAGVGGYEPSKQDGFDNLLHGKPERMTSTAQQGMIGTLTLASELPEPLMASDSRRRRVTTGGLQPTTADESDTDTIRYMVRGSNGRVGDSGTRDSSKPAGPESSRWRLQIMKAVKERTDSSPAEAPLPVHPEGASLIADDGPTPRQVRPVRGGTDDFPGTLGDLTPSMATAATRFQDGDKTQPLAAAAAAGRGHKGAAAIDSSSSTSLEDSTTGIATSLRATVDPGSQIGGDIKDSDDGHGDDDEEDCTAWRVGDGEETPGEWKNLDKAEAREMIAAELLRMQTFAADSKVQVDNRETEAYQPPKAGAPLLPSGPLQQQVTLAAQNRNESPKGMAASAAPAAADDVDASGGAIATDAQEVPDAAPPPSSRFRLTKFHSLGRGAAKAVLQPSTAAGSYLSAAMLRASAAAALDNVRRVSCNDGAAGLLAATATVAAAKLIPAGGASAGGAAVASSTASTDPARLFVAIPQDSLESWVHNHSRRFTAERGCAAPLGPLDPLDELSEVTGFRTSATPPPPPPPAATAAGETTPAAMPFQWATAPQALHRGARLVPEPEVLQVWLSRNGSSMMERGADLQPHQQDSRHGGGGAGAAVPVMRQSLPGNVRLGVKM